MERLYRYFFSADTTDADKRTFGIEVETLFVDEVTHHPIDYRRSQQLMSQLVSGGKWRPRIVDKGSYTELSADGFALKYEVGSNLLEITTPAVTVSHKDMLFSLLGKHLEQLYSAAASVNAVSCESHYDGSTETALVLNSKSSFLDFDLNGDSFAHLAHIAAVHFNIDLESVYQGLQWMRQMTSYFEMRDWPLPESRHCWQMFLAQSPAGYEVERYGKPPDADEYLRTLAGLRVYKNRTLSEPFLENPPRPFYECEQVDIDLFVASVWWWSRLRVRHERLVLEIRAVPRSSDGRLRSDFEDIRRFLNF